MYNQRSFDRHQKFEIHKGSDRTKAFLGRQACCHPTFHEKAQALLETIPCIASHFRQGFVASTQQVHVAVAQLKLLVFNFDYPCKLPLA